MPSPVSVVRLLNDRQRVLISLKPIVQSEEVTGCEFLPYISLLVPCKELYFLCVECQTDEYHAGHGGICEPEF